jgi:hypothetical protein
VVVIGDAVWPLVWYWRDPLLQITEPEPGAQPQLLVCDPRQERELRSSLGAEYRRERIPLRAWWLMNQRRPSVREVLRYLLTRQPWGYLGSTDIIILRRLEGSPGLPESGA